MKKTILSAFAFVAIAASITIYSCKKETQTQLQQPPSASSGFNVSVKNNLLVFKTTEDYRNVVDNSSPEQMVKFMSEVKAMTNFTSYDKQYFSKNPSLLSDSTLINSDFLKTILNKDAAVQIGNYIYKIDIANEKVFALHASHEDQYVDVVNGNTSNSNVQSFSTNDNVLDLIEESGQKKTESTMLFCKEDGIGSYAETTNYIYVDNDGEIRLKGDLAYRRFGIYFHLFAEGFIVDRLTNIMTSINMKIEVDYNSWYYHVRCGKTVGPYTPGPFSGAGHYKYDSYEGSSSLNKVFVRTRYTATVPPSPSAPFGYVKTSNWIQIRVNY